MSAMITCDNVSIRYITGDFKDIGLKEYFIRKLKHEYHVTEFWADRHVTFELEPGDMLGIIGSNGAGKSTLLKAISGIMVPTEGSVQCNGKIAALLELASGFDGDLTVRENTYLRAAMLGYNRAFVDATYDAIIDFAELRGFEDRPFKQLSSGMKSRLAFSIASLVDPEVLILDEVLSVGDGAFRKKSEAKMREIISGGATTLLVSHSTGQVRSLCNKILWLDHGNQVAFGNNVKGLCDAYEKYLNTKKLPTKDELPPLFIDSPVPAPAQKAQGKAVPANGTGAAVSGEAACASAAEAGQGSSQAPAAPKSFIQRVASLPKAARIAALAFAALIAVIAVSEATLPGRIQALPVNDSALMYADDAHGVRVCLRDNKLYVFSERAHTDEDGMLFAVRAQDSHGNVTRETFDIAACANARYSTADDYVLEVNLARYVGYTEVQYGEVEAAHPMAGDELDWAWSETYARGQQVTLKRG